MESKSTYNWVFEWKLNVILTRRRHYNDAKLNPLSQTHTKNISIKLQWPCTITSINSLTRSAIYVLCQFNRFNYAKTQSARGNTMQSALGCVNKNKCADMRDTPICAMHSSQLFLLRFSKHFSLAIFSWSHHTRICQEKNIGQWNAAHAFRAQILFANGPMCSLTSHPLDKF